MVTSYGGGILSSFGPYWRQIAATRLRYSALVGAAFELPVLATRTIPTATAIASAAQASPTPRRCRVNLPPAERFGSRTQRSHNPSETAIQRLSPGRTS